VNQFQAHGAVGSARQKSHPRKQKITHTKGEPELSDSPFAYLKVRCGFSSLLH